MFPDGEEGNKVLEKIIYLLFIIKEKHHSQERASYN